MTGKQEIIVAAIFIIFIMFCIFFIAQQKTNKIEEIPEEVKSASPLPRMGTELPAFWDNTVNKTCAIMLIPLGIKNYRQEGIYCIYPNGEEFEMATRTATMTDDLYDKYITEVKDSVQERAQSLNWIKTGYFHEQ